MILATVSLLPHRGLQQVGDIVDFPGHRIAGSLRLATPFTVSHGNRASGTDNGTCQEIQAHSFVLCKGPLLEQPVQTELANEFLPKLLCSRLLHHRTAFEAGAAHQDFSGPLSQLPIGLRACFSDEPKLRDQQLALLGEADRTGRRGALSIRLRSRSMPMLSSRWPPSTVPAHSTWKRKSAPSNQGRKQT